MSPLWMLATLLACTAALPSLSKRRSAQPTSAVTCALCKEAFKLIDAVVEGNTTYDTGARACPCSPGRTPTCWAELIFKLILKL